MHYTSRREAGDGAGAIEAFQAAAFITQGLLAEPQLLPANHRSLSMQLSFIESRIGEMGDLHKLPVFVQPIAAPGAET